MIRTRVAPLLLSLFAIACVPESAPIASATPAPAPVPAPVAKAPPPAAIDITIRYDGELTQGGWLRGTAPRGTKSLTLDGQALEIAPDGAFFAAFDRDAGPQETLVATFANAPARRMVIPVAPRAWQIEHINIARKPGGASADFMKIRQPELDAIHAARAQDTDAQGWRQRFVWPVTGRISGRFGSQRIYRGEPGSYHSGIDITTGTSGSPYVAPADGVVVLAVQDYSLEGNLLIIDHGDGLNSAFLHSSRLYVKQGDHVKQGQHIGDIGMSGRATGPHLHWSLMWRDARLDPLLFTGPMN